ncbi:hemin-degrading factor [Bartonella sp. DGB2]|uniref:hemin-degrading factor n=1 Tax=Bartonella sp. DGB2 TaxID=3388426 RepID=UPI00398FEDAA
MVYTPTEIITLRQEKKGLFDRDFAASINITEAELMAAYCAVGQAKKLNIDVDALLTHANKLGKVLTITRNEDAVHELRGVLGKPIESDSALVTLGSIDLRIFKKEWTFGFARTIEKGDKQLRTVQFYDKYGTAIFKLYTQEETDLAAWEAMIKHLLSADQSSTLKIAPASLAPQRFCPPDEDNIKALRARWNAMQDVHELYGILQSLKIDRYDAVKYIGEDYARSLDISAIEQMLKEAARRQTPIMCFIGNRGCIQIFTGTIETIKPTQGWLNILDTTFNMHLRLTDIGEVWAVRKPNSNGYVSSLEVFNKKNELIVQFFGLRKEGQNEREDWREILTTLPVKKEMAIAAP